MLFAKAELLDYIQAFDQKLLTKKIKAAKKKLSGYAGHQKVKK
jgi:hypothetical protein